jgi:hypothetical protein
MWQVDNDRYAVWRLEHEVGARQRVDRLLNSVTLSDRAESPTLFRLSHQAVAGLGRRLFGLLYSRAALRPIVPRALE